MENAEDDLDSDYEDMEEFTKRMMLEQKQAAQKELREDAKKTIGVPRRFPDSKSKVFPGST